MLQAIFMFIRKVHKKNDYISFRIVENYRGSGKVKQKSMCYVEQAHKGDQQKLESLARIAEELQWLQAKKLMRS